MTKKMINESMLPFLEFQVKKYNDSKGNLIGYYCPICKNKGYIDSIEKHEDLGYYERMTTICECKELRKLQQGITSQLGEYANKSMNDFIAKEDWQKKIKQLALTYIQDNENKWFIITGQVGSGKTLITSIIVNQLAKQNNNRVLKICWTDFIGTIKRQMMTDSVKTANQQLNDVKSVPILYIDEMLKTIDETSLKYLAEIINTRYNNSLRTIVSSEKDINELLEIEEATISRILEKSDIYSINISKDMTKNQRIKKMLNSL